MKVNENKIKEWKEMTDNNLHSEVRLEIAVHFGFHDYKMMFKRFVEKDGLTCDEYDERNRLFEAMLARIKGLFGDEVAKEIYHVC